MTKSFKIITLGCKVNQYESAYLDETLSREGYRRVSGHEKADIAIINTCIVTQKAAYQSRQAIRKTVRENPSGFTAAVGCYAQVFPEELRDIEGLNLIAGNTVKGQLPGLLLKNGHTGGFHFYHEDFSPSMRFEFLPIRGFLDRTRAFLKVQEGCRSFCSYCIVPYARGPLRSLSPSAAVSALGSLSGQGFREVVLTGIHLGKYGVDLDPPMNLKDLLRVTGKARPALRIRLSSLHPDEMDRDLIDMAASEDWICPHFHISLQSGDNGVLKLMNRRYSAGDFTGIVETIHRVLPQAAIGVDLIAGFPGEGREAFRNTYDLIEGLPVSYLHVFPFSPRKGTPAADFPDQVDPAETKERAGALRKLGRKKRSYFYQSCLGSIFPVLSEGWEDEEKGLAKGWSDNYVPVVFASGGSPKNRAFRVRLEKLTKKGVWGKVFQ